MLKPFDDYVTGPLYKGSLPAFQRDPLHLIIAGGVARKRSVEEIAYALATAHHETRRFFANEEAGRGRDHDYGALVWVNRRRSVTYHGRGMVMLTWLGNYAAMSPIVGVDLVTYPEKAAEWELSADIMWEGMIQGTFTTRKLDDYFGGDTPDYFSARAIINGNDKAALIADYAREFEAALRLGDLPADECPCCGRPMET